MSESVGLDKSGDIAPDEATDQGPDGGPETLSVVRGGCLCGAVRFIAEDVEPRFGVCHCNMCQKWTGSSLAEVAVPEAQVHWRGMSNITVYKSSAWGERAFCKKCGSGLWFRVTEEGEHSGNYDIPLGLFDDTSPFELAYEIYVDKRPPALRYEDRGQVTLTRADCVEKFPRLGETDGWKVAQVAEPSSNKGDDHDQV